MSHRPWGTYAALAVSALAIVVILSQLAMAMHRHRPPTPEPMPVGTTIQVPLWQSPVQPDMGPRGQESPGAVREARIYLVLPVPS